MSCRLQEGVIEELLECSYVSREVVYSSWIPVVWF